MDFLTDNDNENLKFLIGGMVALAIMFSLWHFMDKRKPISTTTDSRTTHVYHAPGAAQDDTGATPVSVVSSNPSSSTNSGAGTVTGAALKGNVNTNATPVNSVPGAVGANGANPPANGINTAGAPANGVNNGQAGVNPGAANPGTAPGSVTNSNAQTGGAINRNASGGVRPVGTPIIGAASTGASNNDSMAGNNSSALVGANGPGNAPVGQSGTAGGNNQSGTTGVHSVPIHPMTSPGY